MLAGAARAEFTPGAVLPEYSLKASLGSTFSFSRKSSRAAGAQSLAPKVLLVHLFHPASPPDENKARHPESVQVPLTRFVSSPPRFNLEADI